MREGMVLEVYKDHVVVLARGGEYLKLRKKGEVNIGDIYSAKPYFKLPTYYVAAAIMLIIFSSYTGITAYANQIVGYVDINGDKNVRLYVNRKGTVQKVDGLENSQSLKNLTIENAAKEISKISKKEKIFEDTTKIEISTKEIKSSGVNFDKEKDKLEKALLKKEEVKDPKENKGNGNDKNPKENKGSKENKNSKENNGNALNKSAEKEKGFEKVNQKKNENKNNGNKNEKN